MAYTTGAEVKAELTTDLTAETIDDEIIPEVEAYIDNLCGTTFSLVEDYEEVISGDGDNTLILSMTPVVEVVEVLIGTSLVADSTYLLDGRCLIRKGTVWPSGTGNITVTYSYGYTDVPEMIKRAARLLTIDWILHRQENRYERQAEAGLAVSEFEGATNPEPPKPLAEGEITGDKQVDQLLRPFMKKRASWIGSV